MTTSAGLLIRACGWLAAGLLVFSAQAQPVPVAEAVPSAQELQRRAQARDQERAHITRQRVQIEARKTEAEQACWQRFVVENCLREARAQARMQDKALQERELQLNSEERQEKAAERLRAIEQKQREKLPPAPMTATTKQGAVGQPLGMAAQPDAAQAQAERAKANNASAAQQRAAQQALRQRQHVQDVARREAEAAQQRAKRQQALQDRQQAAQARRERQQEQSSARRVQPLPIPQGMPQP